MGDAVSRLFARRASPSKYGNVRARLPELPGRTFDSQREAMRAYVLLRLQQEGHVRGLRFQVTYRLAVNGVPITAYRADFVYEEAAGDGGWRTVVEDVKGYPTKEYAIKKRLMLALYQVEIRET